MGVIKKAWRINPRNLREPWFADTDRVYYGTRGQAKQLALVDHDSMITDDDEDLTYLNIKVSRNPEYDMVRFRESIVSKKEVSNIMKVEERNEKLAKLLKDNPNGKAFVYNGTYNSYWGWNHCGYATNKFKAGIYDLKEAVRIVRGSSLDRRESVILINPEEHNAEVLKKINELKEYMIQE